MRLRGLLSLQPPVKKRHQSCSAIGRILDPINTFLGVLSIQPTEPHPIVRPEGHLAIVVDISARADND